MKNQTSFCVSFKPLAAGLVIAGMLAFSAVQAKTPAQDVAQANGLCKNSYSLISYELRPRSVPRFIMALEGDLALSPEQRQQLKQVTDYVPKNVLPMRDEIKAFETKIVEDFVQNGQTPEQLASRLDELQAMKRRLAEEEIRVFNQIKDLLTPAQYQEAVKRASGE
ncbi:hypothetical protein JX580_11035 [Thiomicrospira microaerophila]|uniref:hypothetical protein n=1 Tax=Thiomicrospira microaerophila TaxID=406020 RepID=UPI00200CCF18|nr:hypothetical protein [Thiomicrospira microaerophila]UQB42174.1 hypothetical protein JX580_11035 [Thiomicrospira microaerophila]